MRKITLLIGILISFSTVLHGQANFGLAIKTYDTQGDFNKNINKVPFGLGLCYLHSPDESRWALGGELGIAM